MTFNTPLRLVTPTKEKRTVTPRRRSNSELRPREHLTEREIEKLIAAAKSNSERSDTRGWAAFGGTLVCPTTREGIGCVTFPSSAHRAGVQSTYLDSPRSIAALQMSPIGPERRLLRDSNTSGIGGRAEMAGARSKRR